MKTIKFENYSAFRNHMNNIISEIGKSVFNGTFNETIKKYINDRYEYEGYRYKIIEVSNDGIRHNGAELTISVFNGDCLIYETYRVLKNGDIWEYATNGEVYPESYIEEMRINAESQR